MSKASEALARYRARHKDEHRFPEYIESPFDRYFRECGTKDRETELAEWLALYGTKWPKEMILEEAWHLIPEGQ